MTPPPPTECVNAFLREAVRLGVAVRWTRDGMTKLDAAYRALPGKPGVILLHDRTPRPNTQEVCTLLAHEMVHVMQHWKGNLKALPPLGWPVDKTPPGRNLPIREQEAYTAQNEPQKVLKAVRLLNPATTQVSP